MKFASDIGNDEMFELSLNRINLCRRRRKCHSRLPAHTIF